jgi:hypothetical protein
MVVYLFGGGVGESTVVAFPDRRVAVIDACGQGSKNLPRALVHHLGLGGIHLLALTHPDLDHVRGFAELVAMKPELLWRYPGDPSLRDFATRCATSSGNTVLAEALAAIDDYAMTNGIMQEVAYGSRIWPSAGSEYQVRTVAPTPSDRVRAMKVWEKLLKFSRGRARLEKLIQRGSSSFGDAPNVLSLALVVEWDGRRILFGGDVMRGRKRGRGASGSGWKGIVTVLANDPDPAMRTLLDDVDVVKVAHHGSRHSFDESVWKRHAPSGGVVAMLAPYTPSDLPDAFVLRELRKYATTLAVSSVRPSDRQRVERAGWQHAQGKPVSAAVPLAGVVIHRGGQVESFASSLGGVWH